MNSKFFDLPVERQNAIISAGCKVFSRFGYKKAPMSEIAQDAGISKALLFHYFHNKKEYYLYLYNYSVNLMLETVRSKNVIKSRDLFEIFLDSLMWQCEFAKQFPNVSSFLFRTVFEDDPDVVSELKSKTSSVTLNSSGTIFKIIEKDKFRDGVDIKQLINMLVWCGEGYKREIFSKNLIDIDAFQAGYEAIIEQFRKLSYKEEYLL